MYNCVSRLFICAVCIIIAHTAAAQEFVSEIRSPEGVVVTDYFEREIVVQAFGASGEEHRSIAQRRLWALNEAKKNCYTLAAMAACRVNVYGKTILEAGRVKSQNIELHIRNYVRGITDIQEDCETQPDGSVLATVTLTVMFDGNNGLNTLLYNYLFDDVKVGAETEEGLQRERKYTGVVLDVRDFPVQPSIAPQIYDTDGHLVYGPGAFTREYAMRFGIVGYTKDLRNVADRIGENPLPFDVVALKEGDPSSVVISAEDAEHLLELDEEYGLLSSCRIAFRVK